jgi:hypothetical protein
LTYSPEHSKASSFGARWSVTRRVAMLILKGPRSIMLPHDPEGLSHWLSPVLRMTARPLPPIGTVESMALYCLPPFLDSDPRLQPLLRHSRWDEPAERKTCKANNVPLRPSVAISCSVLSLADKESVEGYVRALEKAIASFRFLEERLVEDSAASGHMQIGNAVVSGVRCLGLWRTTRSYSLDLEWLETQKDTNAFNQAWRKLWSFLKDVGSKCHAADPGLVERYDVTPEEEYARLLDCT